MGEDALPDAGAQSRGRQRTADDIAQDLIEGPLDLAEAGEGVARIVEEFVAGRQAQRRLEEVTPVRQKFAIELPAARQTRRCPEGGVVETRIEALIEMALNGVSVKQEIALARRDAGVEAIAQLPGQDFQPPGDAPDVRARPLRLIDGKAPDRLAFDEAGPRAARSNALCSGRKGLEEARPADGFQESALREGKETAAACTFNVLSMS